MRNYLITVALIVAFATPALAADYYVALRLGDGGGCVIMDHKRSQEVQDNGRIFFKEHGEKGYV